MIFADKVVFIMALTIFAERMKQARTGAGMKQNELAKAVGVTPATISAYEKASTDGNGKNPTLENAQKIAKALGVSLDWICGNGQPTPDDVTSFSLQDYLKSVAIALYEMSVKSEYDKENGHATIYIENPAIALFVTKVQQLLFVYRSGTLTREMYNDCIKRLVTGFKGHCFDFGNLLTEGEALDAESSVDDMVSNYPEVIGTSSIETTLLDRYSSNNVGREVNLLIEPEFWQHYEEQEANNHAQHPTTEE